MCKKLLRLSILLIITSCIPLRIAPKIENYKVTEGKKFKRSLPKRTVFVFEDPKEANEFYTYVNTKFQLNHDLVDIDVPFSIQGNPYYFSFYEVEIPNKAINLFPLILEASVNAALDCDDALISDPELIRNGNYYIAIEVYDKEEKDCLAEESLSRTSVLTYLRGLKNEYLSTQNYDEVVFKH